VDRLPIKKHIKYQGNRVKRGLFKSSQGMKINAPFEWFLEYFKKSSWEFCFYNNGRIG